MGKTKGYEWMQSNTKIAVVLGAGGAILIALADLLSGSVALGATVEVVWKAVVVGVGVIGVRGWFKD